MIASVILVPRSEELWARPFARWGGAPVPPASVVYDEDFGDWGPGWGPLCDEPPGVRPRVGLPIWWKGELVEPGFDRARRVFAGVWIEHPGPHGGAPYLLRMARVYSEELSGVEFVALGADGAPIPEAAWFPGRTPSGGSL